MKHNHFITADLSTYNTAETMPFYQAVFGWAFHQQPGTTDDTHGAYLGNQEVASIYQTPEKFQQMKMPHFWMGYIQVNDIDKTVATAKSLGGIIELTLDFSHYGKVALIRDPQGAGFTVYEGDEITPTRTKNQANTLIWNELHISNAANIIPFYQGIFDWQFEQDSTEPSHYRIFSGGEHIADAREIPNSIKGKYEYWVCTFGVTDLQASKDAILANGGTLIMDEGERLMMSDNSGSAFFYIKQTDGKLQGSNQTTQPVTGAITQTSNNPTTKSPLKWKAMLGLVLIFAAVLSGQYWILGIFFLIWLVMDIRTGMTHLFEAVSKQNNPILYWLIMATWVILSGFSFIM